MRKVGSQFESKGGKIGSAVSHDLKGRRNGFGLEVLRSRGEVLERKKRKEEGRREKEAKSLSNCDRNRSSFVIRFSSC